MDLSQNRNNSNLRIQTAKCFESRRISSFIIEMTSIKTRMLKLSLNIRYCASTPTNLMKSFLFIMLILCVGCHSSNSQSRSSNSKEQVEEIDLKKIHESIEVFFDKYKLEGSSKAIDYIFRTNNLVTSPDQLDNLKNKLDSTRKFIGDYKGNVLITEKNASSDLILLTYLVKHEKQPIRFSFIFYRPEKDWVLFKFQYDDQVISELEDSGKIYFIK
jgi:hypothetical protein